MLMGKVGEAGVQDGGTGGEGVRSRHTGFVFRDRHSTMRRTCRHVWGFKRHLGEKERIYYDNVRSAG